MPHSGHGRRQSRSSFAILRPDPRHLNSTSALRLVALDRRRARLVELAGRLVVLVLRRRLLPSRPDPELLIARDPRHLDAGVPVRPDLPIPHPPERALHRPRFVRAELRHLIADLPQ